jgi:hypothetical protein
VLHVNVRALAEGSPYDAAHHIATVWLAEHDPAPF